MAAVVATRLMFVIDAVVVNIARPSIRADPRMSEAGIEAVIVRSQIAFAMLAVTGGRFGDPRGFAAIVHAGQGNRAILTSAPIRAPCAAW